MNHFGIFLRGLLMGAADIVPGVSGGTVAFITGIYDTLLDSIRSVDLQFVQHVFTFDIKAAWLHINGNFLLALFAGVATSIFSLARLISWLLVTHPIPLWAFFFGLILASALILLRQVGRWNVVRFFALLIGISIAAAIALSPSVSLELGLAGVFLSGFLAICAMILPGISGSFILVLLGMYGVVLTALKSLDIGFIAVFILGAASGLLCFSRLLHYLLRRFHGGTMSVLTGFLLGSLLIVWPWKKVLVWIESSSGELKPAQLQPITPAEYLSITGNNPQLGLCIALILLGFLLVWWIDRYWGVPATKL